MPNRKSPDDSLYLTSGYWMLSRCPATANSSVNPSFPPMATIPSSLHKRLTISSCSDLSSCSSRTFPSRLIATRSVRTLVSTRSNSAIDETVLSYSASISPSHLTCAAMSSTSSLTSSLGAFPFTLGRPGNTDSRFISVETRSFAMRFPSKG